MKSKLLLALLIPIGIYAQTETTISNNTFESTSNWVPTNATTSIDTNGQTNNALSFTANASSNTTNKLTSNTFTIPNNSNCIVKLWVKSNVANQKIKFTVSNDGADIYTSAQINLGSTQGNWQYISSNVFSSGTQTNTSMWTISFTLPGGANKTLSFDELNITINPLTVNGDFETDFFHQNKTLGLTNVYNKNQINPFTVSQDFANSGTYSVKLTNVFATGGKSTFSPKIGYRHIAEIGKKYQGSIYVRANTGQTLNIKSSLMLNGIENKGDNLYTSVSDSWTLIRTPLIDSTTDDEAYIIINSNTEDAIFYIDDINISKTDNTATLSSNKISSENILFTKNKIRVKENNYKISIFSSLGNLIIYRDLKNKKTLNFSFNSNTMYLILIINSKGETFTTKYISPN